jgi:Ohr subfamily peroxiredoxin
MHRRSAAGIPAGLRRRNASALTAVHATRRAGSLMVRPATIGSPRDHSAHQNPEQLFAAGYAACFQSALGVVGRRQGVDTSDSLVEADVSIGPVQGGAYGLAVKLRVTIPGADPEQVRSLTEAAHQVCPYSNATRGNIDVTLEAG